MILQRYTKQPSDVTDYDIDYSDWLRDAETLQSVTPTVACITSDDASVTVAGTTSSTTAVRIRLSGGASGNTYKTTVRVTTSAGRVDDSEFLVVVRDY